MSSMRSTSRRSMPVPLFSSGRAGSSLSTTSLLLTNVGSSGSRVPVARPRRSPSLSSSARASLSTAGAMAGSGDWLRRSSLPGGPATSPLTTRRAPTSRTSSTPSSAPVAARRRARSRSMQRTTLPMPSHLSLGPPSPSSALLTVPSRLSRSASSLMLTPSRLRGVSESSTTSVQSRRSPASSGYGSSSTLNRSVSGDVSGSDDTLSVRVESKSAGISSGNSALNGDVDYKKLYEEAMVENDRLRVQLNSVEEEFRETKRHAEKSVQLANSRVAAVESEQRENRALERKLAEMEEDLKQMAQLRAENERLRAENRSLNRVVAKLTHSVTSQTAAGKFN